MPRELNTPRYLKAVLAGYIQENNHGRPSPQIRPQKKEEEEVKKLNTPRYLKAVDLRNEGLTYKAIGQVLDGVSIEQARRLVKRGKIILGIKDPPFERIYTGKVTKYV